MKKIQSKKRIILAVDPWDAELKPNAKALSEITYWAEKMNASVEAVYVMSYPKKDSKFAATQKQAIANLSKLMSGVKTKTPPGVTVLVDRSMSRRHEVKTFLNYAKKCRADLILLSSHGRRGIGRLVFGSFAEAVVSDAPSPVVFLGSMAFSKKSGQAAGSVLFPTDFTDSSRKAYLDLINQYSFAFSDVIIFHSLTPRSLFNDYSLLGVGTYIPETYWKSQKEIVLSLGRSWLEDARQANVQAKILLDDENLDPAQAILKAAKDEKATFIAMACNAVGGIASDVFRTKRETVWVYGPAFKQKSREELLTNPDLYMKTKSTPIQVGASKRN